MVKLISERNRMAALAAELNGIVARLLLNAAPDVSNNNLDTKEINK
jgi:hypothetical protein